LGGSVYIYVSHECDMPGKSGGECVVLAILGQTLYYLATNIICCCKSSVIGAVVVEVGLVLTVSASSCSVMSCATVYSSVEM
jgi:hypothetical protein